MLSRVLSRRMASSAAAAGGGASPGAALGRVFLGLDSSTQGIKATAVDASLKVLASFAVNYQATLGAKHKLVNGVHAGAGNAVTQPTLMYIEALELLLAKMKAGGFDVSQRRERARARGGDRILYGGGFLG
jgi:hypothetical protein